MSLRDPEGRGLWLKRNAIAMGEVESAEDFILIDFQGRRLEGSGGCHSEWPIHAEIMKMRPDIHAVAHTHPYFSTLFSATDETLRPVTMEGSYFSGTVPHYRGTGALINTADLGHDLARTLGQGFAVFMKNHGITFCGRSVEHALLMGVFLEKASRAQLQISASGLAWHWLEDQDATVRTSQILTDVHIEHSWGYYCRKLEWVTRNLKFPSKGLFGSD
jgi:ribulose-5-phosphate 4-epimerase/fuculose-1-phosphate aldolase